jgi:hypothetical protein
MAGGGADSPALCSDRLNVFGGTAMNVRPSVMLAGAGMLGCLVLGLCLGPAQSGRAQGEPQAHPGRYQVVIEGREGNPPTVVVMDTATGHTWSRIVSSTNPWYDMGVPGERKR